jgi:hypothetical protein
MTWLRPKYMDADGVIFQPKKGPVEVALANGEAGDCVVVYEENVKANTRQVVWTDIPQGATLCKDGHALWRAPAGRLVPRPIWPDRSGTFQRGWRGIRAIWGDYSMDIHVRWDLRDRAWSWRPSAYITRKEFWIGVADWGALCLRISLRYAQYVSIELHWPIVLDVTIWKPVERPSGPPRKRRRRKVRLTSLSPSSSACSI